MGKGVRDYIRDKQDTIFFTFIGLCILLVAFTSFFGYSGLRIGGAEELAYESRIFRLNPQAYEFMGRYRPETVGEFTKRVLDFASDVEAYDITYHSTSILLKKVKGYVITPSRPQVVFFGDGQTALVWWWTSRERFTIKLKED